MSLEKLINKINEKELKIREEIQAENNEELAKIKEKFDNEFAVFSEIQRKATDDKIEFLKQKENTQLDIDKRKNVLNIKRDIIKEVYKKFQDSVYKMNVNDYKEWLIKRISSLDNIDPKAKLVIGSGVLKDVIDDNFKSKIKSNVVCEVEYNDLIDFGFKYEHGAIIINNTLDSIIAGFKLEKELELSKILF